jgi:DNA polymerase III alpha subunit (gram-positive type)
MITYQCGNCKYVKDFSVQQSYQLKQEKCPKCTTVGRWLPYTGPMAAIILETALTAALL